MSTINSLGIGSGVLTSDLIDQLREVDDTNVLKPLEDKIALGVQKEEAYNLLSSLMTTFKSSATALSGDNLYLNRAVSGNTDAVTVTADSGSAVSSFEITDIDRAQADVWNSSTFDEDTTPLVGLGEGILTVSVDGEDFEVEYTSDSSLSAIKDSINELAGDKMTASVLQVGESSYELVITAKDTNKAITFADDNPDADSLENILALNNIQDQKAATFKYNGVEISRDTNEIDDLIIGVTISLNQNQEATDSASINIAQNDTSINTEMSLFVSSYNALITNLNDMTRANRESGSVGIFNGDSFVKSIARDLSTIVTRADSNGNSLMDYGIDIDRYGEMSLDSSVFNEKFTSNPEAMELFFSGDSETDGIFTKLDDRLNEYTGYNKLLSNFSDQISSLQTNTTDQYDKQKASLDNRYEIMTTKFIAYDAMISRMNSQFSSFQMMIDAQYADND